MSTFSTPPPDSKDAVHRPLGQRIADLAAACRQDSVTLQELAENLDGRSFYLLIFLVSLPFCQPVPMLGLSTPLGLFLAFLGWRMTLGLPLRVPLRLRHIKIPRKFFPRLLAGAGRLLRWLEKHRGNDWGAVTELFWVQRLCGANLLLCAALLALPLPIPFSNFFPALPIALSMAALVESDGKMLLRAAVAAGFNLLFWLTWLVLIILYGWPVVEKTEAAIRGWLGW